ncbi:hypothetical protein [Caulobacter sp. 17J65-9]|uniref:hypothetical protein n=1 Tax=Caulobacter sp. 17J65-9 TaxID=2709382 RepID=UPI0013CD58B0|nr:hypothetical protein [Caulobacter sp. 17J65-9]NEX92145.1 hypothetical protein [Caulobacter sp. 17J65-9]
MQETQPSLLVQYQVFAEQRRHFGRLFWLSIAFVLAMLLGVAAAFHDLPAPLPAWLVLGGGIALVQTGYIAHRLRGREDDYEGLMRTLEEKLQAAGAACLLGPVSKGGGARSMVTLSLAAAGVVAIAAGAWLLYRG